MKAVWFEKQGAPDVLQFGELPTPTPLANEVLARIHTSGVNPSDVKTRAGARGAMPFPRQIPHSDGAGIIEAVGKDVPSSRIGERIWLWNAAINRAHGACAEYIAIPAEQAIVMRDNTDFVAAACFGVPLMTAVYGVIRGGNVKDKTLLISGGAGAVGFYAIQAAKLRGATVITTVSSDDKKTHAQKANPDYIIDYKNENVSARIMDITNGQGVNNIIEVEFGGNLPITEKVIKFGGVITAYGSMANPAPPLPFYPLMFKNITLNMFLIYNITANARRHVIQTINDIEPQLTHAIAEVLPIQQTAQAHAKIEAGDTIGNIVISTI